jgi:hypothetical protein
VKPVGGQFQPQLPGTEWFKGDFRPSSVMSAGVRAMGVDPESVAGVRANPNTTARLGASARDQEKRGAPTSDSLNASYDSLRGDIKSQFSHLTSPTDKGGLGVNVEYSATDPYKNPMELRDDIDNNRRLRVMDTGANADQAHSIFSNDENNQFRAVHDAFGHAPSGRNFSRHGEESAFQLHAKTVKPESMDALRSETQMQNSYLNFNGGFPENRTFETPVEKSASLRTKTKPPRLPGF